MAKDLLAPGQPSWQYLGITARRYAAMLIALALTVGCTSESMPTSSTTATPPTTSTPWSEAFFGDVVGFCQGAGGGADCPVMTRAARDLLGCTVEGAYLVIGEYLVTDEMRGGLLVSTPTESGPPEYPQAPWANGMELEEARAVLQDRLDGAYRAGECTMRFQLFSEEGAHLGFPLPSD